MFDADSFHEIMVSLSRHKLRTALTAIAAAVSVFAANAQTVSSTDSESGRIWFVELEGAPTADGRTLFPFRRIFMVAVK